MARIRKMRLVRKLLPSPALALLVVLCGFFAALTLQWVRLDRVPPNWDDAWYLTNSLIMYDAFAQGGVTAYAQKFFSVLGFKAPLITVLPTPFYLILGRNWRLAYLVNVVFVFVLLFAVYAIGKRLRNSRTGLIAASVTATMPLLYGLSRWFLVEYALAAIVAVTIWLLLVWESNETVPAAVLFGVVCGLGLLLKVSFPLFVLPAFLYALLRSPRRGRTLAAAAIPCLLLALPWYAVHFRETIANALRAGYGDSASVQGTGDILSWRAITTYLAKVGTDGVSTYYAALFVLLAVMLVIPAPARIRLKDATRRELLRVALWIVPFLLFLFGGNKDVRYIAPILPGFALALACLLDIALPARRWAPALAVLLLAYPLLSLFETSFGFPRRSPALGYARRYSSEEWPNREVLGAIRSRGGLRKGVRDSLLVGTDRAAFNANNFELIVVEARLPLSVSTTAYETDLDAVLRMIDGAGFFVYKDGGEPESRFFNRHFTAAVKHVLEGSRFTEIPFGRIMPDGGVPRIFRNTRSTSASLRYEARAGEFVRGVPDRTAQPIVSFGELIDLTSLSTESSGDGLDVRFRWRCTRTPGREYWCFVHVLDPDGKMIGNLDHRILEGNPPLRDWRPGDAASEVLRWRPSNAGVQPVRLRLGVYDVATSERLKIVVPAASALTSTDDGTAVLYPIPIR